MVIPHGFICSYQYLKIFHKEFFSALRRRENLLLMVLSLLLGLGISLLFTQCEHQHQEIAALEQKLKEQEAMAQLWQDYQKLADQYPEDHQHFKKSFLLIPWDCQKIERVLRRLLHDLMVPITEMNVTKIRSSSTYDVFHIDITVQSLSDEDVFFWLKKLTLPHVLEITHGYLRRVGSVPEGRGLHGKIPWLIQAKVSLTWLGWHHG
jgi:hypothetical protein